MRQAELIKKEKERSGGEEYTDDTFQSDLKELQRAAREYAGCEMARISSRVSCTFSHRVPKQNDREIPHHLHKRCSYLALVGNTTPLTGTV
eukprot:scaffold547_cov143-Skeletonema_menzelii.AAC.20